MTREQAITHGKEQLEVFGGEHREFIEMAIKALEQSCEDAVSRKDVINYIRTLACDLSYWSVTDEVVKDIEALPSVTPTHTETVTEFADRCRECGREKVLDKIRAEIEQIEINGHIRDVECFRAGINVALNVIDKYRAERRE